MSTAAGIELLGARPLLVSPVDVTVRLAPGDRPLVAVGESVAPGAPIVERLRDAHVAIVEPAADLALRPGDRWPLESGHHALEEQPLIGAGGARPTRRASGRHRSTEPAGELLFEAGGRWRLATAEHADPLESPVAGIVREVRPGMALVIRASGSILPGTSALGGTSHGRLDLAAAADGEVRPAGIDVGSSGTILVVGSRVDAETITRARAMGVRGLIVGGLAGKERRDFAASERRQRAAIHRVPPFAVLVIDGAVRRPIAEPIMALLTSLAGHDVAIVDDPPGLVIDAPGVRLPEVASDAIRVRNGPLAGRSGRWRGLAGIRRFAAGTQLEAGLVALDGEPPVALPLADLERWS
ncbi:MAG TPA: hypothetical protein VH720_09645 [Candidatus Limnocylindrales bacterium]